MPSLELAVHVRPNARRTVVGGTHDGVLVVAVAAAPSDGQANDAVVRAVADALGRPKRSVQILRGRTSRRKVLRIELPDDVDVAATIDRLRAG